MAMAYSTLVQPGDEEAKEWYERYQQYCQLSGLMARLYAWRHEPDVWQIGIWTPFLVGGVGNAVSWWIGALTACAAGAYWGWVLERTPRVQRKYERLLRKQRILHVPKFLIAAVDKEAERLGIRSWSEYPLRRFEILRETLLEADPWLRELRNDCGCQKSCQHTNQLARRVRDGLRLRVRTTAQRKLARAGQDHAAAIEVNRLRQRHIRGALGATSQEDD